MTLADAYTLSRYKCIPFFINNVAGTKLKHAQFSAIAVGNLARKEVSTLFYDFEFKCVFSCAYGHLQSFRELLRRHGGIPVLVGCIMSSDYQKRRCVELMHLLHYLIVHARPPPFSICSLVHINACLPSYERFPSYGALALANMALSPSQEIVQVFASKGLLDKVIKVSAVR